MKILNYLKRYSLLIVILIVFTVGQVAATLALPDYTARIINDGIIGNDQNVIVSNGVLMLVVAFAGGICTVIAGYLAARIGTGFSRDLREGLFTKVESFSLAELNSFSTSSLITRSTNDIQQVQMVIVMIMRMVLSAPITAVWAVYKAYSVAPDMSWLMALAVGVLLTIFVVVFSFALPKFKLVQELTDKLNRVARENLTGIRVIRAFNKQLHEAKRLNVVNLDLTRTNLFIARIVALMQPVMFLILNMLSVGVIWVGVHLISDYTLGIGEMLAFMQYAIQVVIAFLLISIVFIMVPRAWVSIRRITEVLSLDALITNPNKPVKPEEKSGTVEFKDVTFGYNNADTPVLENISFTAKSGQTTAFIGSTGSGKSTLINLVPRFYDTLFGEVLIDGVNIREMELHDLRARIGYIPQKAVLFSGTIMSNIAYGTDDASQEQIEKAAEIAQAANFINSFPEKYETQVSQSGTNLSGGQKQRLSIARAIVKDPEILIFDDTFSALDFKTESKLRHALTEITKDKTVLVVAQRVNTILHADQIIVLNQGRIVGIGTHQELMKVCEVYREIARSQLSEEELKKYNGEEEDGRQEG
ncbi:ABC transporter ATP-binding protein [candidate division WWE3 bacterium]|uniref:ABC transporter ATP-binding protein n=1 Tax=candidate division WWE3 bacterium TaxID=2053526 RepID=A0A955LLP3_UNCKA|nr:ABC transporter ATP-binding protein [candidate division WWE3 bacterium]